MHPEMRRKNQKMSEEEVQDILHKTEYGIMSTVNSDLQPTGTPLSYVIMDDYVYFHCALEGTKLNNIDFNNKVSFTLVGKTQPIYDNNFTTYYQSVMVFGKAFKVEDDVEKKKFLKLLCEKYLPNDMEHFEEDVTRSLPHTGVYKISMDIVTSKEKKKR